MTQNESQLTLPGPAPVRIAAERAFVILARKWLEEIQTAGRILPASADNLALSCLLLAVEWGHEFSDLAWQEAGISRETVARRDPSWFEVLPWRLCLASCPTASPLDRQAVSQLTVNLNHGNSSIRSWMMKIGWIACSWLDPAQGIPRLLANLADTLVRPFMAAGLAAELVPTEDEFWILARRFEPRPGFEEQYRERLKLIEERGILAVQAPFWKLEAQCRKAIADATLGREQSCTPGVYLSGSTVPEMSVAPDDRGGKRHG